MVVEDHDYAKHYLKNINYYRLSAYWLPFEIDHSNHRFKPGTRFEDVLQHYNFDRELRLLLLDAIERIEVAVRTAWAYELSHKVNSHAYLDITLFKNAGVYQRCLQNLQEEINRSSEIFIDHYRSKYDTPRLPPIWAIVEVLSLGQLSRWYSNLHRKFSRNIAQNFELDSSVLTSFLHHLSIIRNLCAHHSRVWNRLYVFQLRLPNSGPLSLLGSLNPQEPKRLYNTLILVLHLLSRISPDSLWREKFQYLLRLHPMVQAAAMGFPRDWQDQSVWR